MNGIDVSHHQGKINWGAVALNQTKIDFVFLKATQGIGYVDTAVQYNATEAKKNGFKISYYHYATLNTKDEIADAKKEAQYFINILDHLPPSDFPIALDIEENKVQLSKEEVCQWIKTFIEEMESAGYKNMFLYSYAPFLISNLPPDHGIKNNLWLAGYVKENKLKIPPGWNKYTIWQYSSSGKVNGISTNVDMNISSEPLY